MHRVNADGKTSYPLAVFTPSFGVCSETFIRRHILNLLPGLTVTVTDRMVHNDPRLSGVPILELQGLSRTGEGGARWVMRRLGIAIWDMRLKAMERFLRQHKVEVVLGEYLDQSLPLLTITRELGIRFFAHAHGYDVSMRLREPKWRAEYLRYNQSSGIIAMSKLCQMRLANLGIDRTKIHIIPYGVDVPNETKERKEQKTVRCLAVGRMVAKKAPILTLDAFRRASETYPELRLDYVGAGELFSSAKHFVQAFSLGGKVTLHGAQSHETVLQLMDEADIFLQHSISDSDTGDEEGLPVAILEAMAQGLPVVSTIHAGIPEAVIDGVTGYLVNEGDSTAMAERVLALALDHHARLKLGSAGWRRTKELFTWDKERASLLGVMGLDKAAGV